ncbi:MAG: tRNA (guanine(26)-N(2))-dimethyltransferase [Aquificaceae bacterium]|nr:tRNA (guanine(26)-N(2))-dimethyltransferase [Aquificaceae bacterium]MDW8433220.1 tRNA (guanine(26)-N(2))-dimethyltransferase [Aquificaceae bacterium]
MIREGKVCFELNLPEVVSSRMEVFYNPHMRENRDLSLLLLLTLPFEKLKVCDPMGASGVRLLRMLLETQKLEKAVYNDLSAESAQFFRKLLKNHCVDESMVEIHQEDACVFLRRHRDFHYVEVDPFGSPVPFLESALLSLRRHGILAVSATDTSVLSGTYPSTCFRRYGSMPLLSCEFYHEVGIRILIKKVVEEGAKLDYALEPVFSYSYRHYFRVFFKKQAGPKRADRVLAQVGYLLFCDRCLYRAGVKLEGLQNSCPYCGNRLLVAGPLWLGSLWDRELLEAMWQLRGAVELSENSLKLLKRIRQEATLNTLGFYTLSAIGKAFKLGQPPPIQKFLDIFKGVRTHFSGEGFRTAVSHQEFLERVHELLQRA